MPITVGFDATSAARQAAGIGRYTRELLTALAERDDSTRYRVFYCSGGELQGAMPLLGNEFSVRALPLSDRVTNALWYRLRAPIPVQLVTGRFDLYHSPDFTLPPTLGRPGILTVHDLAFLTVPDCAYPTLRAYLEEVVPRSVRRATHIIAVSQSTQRDLVEWLRVPPERIEVIHEGASSLFRPFGSREAALKEVRALGIDGPYILSVGTLEPRKNYLRLLEAFACLRQEGLEHRLVIAGRRGWLDEPIFERVHMLGLGEEVHFVQPDDTALAALYSAADLFVYPSVYEGFGIPLLEAMACGAPVVCADRSSLPEIVGRAGLLFDPYDVEAMADVMGSVLRDTQLQDRLRAAGPKMAARFSWKRAAEQTHDLYRRVLGHA